MLRMAAAAAVLCAVVLFGGAAMAGGGCLLGTHWVIQIEYDTGETDEACVGIHDDGEMYHGLVCCADGPIKKLKCKGGKPKLLKRGKTYCSFQELTFCLTKLRFKGNKVTKGSGWIRYKGQAKQRFTVTGGDKGNCCH